MQGHETFTLVIAAIAMITGLLLILSPATLIKAGEFFNRAYDVESTVYTKRIMYGFLYIVVGIILLYMVW
ncbi:MAG: hypothetical protein U9Q77_05190 [Candidatus Marinimicrobia bacterium]|nr:hypothetical protein [Candidatus Neomarinimicrobiota bacterium]